MTEEQMNYTITRAQANRQYYLKTLQKELDIGRLSNEKSLAKSRINNPEILAYKARILGNRTSYREYADWTDFLISEYGYKERCLSLGSGIGRVEKYLVSHGFTENMETIELCADVNEGVRLKDTRIDTMRGDLNFVELPPDSYDFILCHGVLHHLINLEHALYQINRSLKANGIFLVYEYVGETRWQFNNSRLEFLRKQFPDIQFKQCPAWRVGGFESVRSGELLALIQSQFGDTCERAVSYGGVYFPFITTTTPKEDSKMKEVIKLDERVSKDGSLAPCYHMGLYRKSGRPAIQSKSWSTDMMESQLCPHTPFRYQLLEFLKRSRFGHVLRSVKRKLG